MVTSSTKFNKISQFLKNPLNPEKARIIGFVGGLMTGLGIAGSIIANENLSVPVIAIIFAIFGYAVSKIGIFVMDYASRNSGSISTIIFALMGADFAGPPGAIAATTFIGVTNVILQKTFGMTIDDMFADSLVASIKGIDQIIHDGHEAITSLPAKEKVTARESAIAKVAPSLATTQITSSNLPQQNTQKKTKDTQKKIKAAGADKKPKKTYTKKLEEARGVTQDKNLTR